MRVTGVLLGGDPARSVLAAAQLLATETAASVLEEFLGAGEPARALAELVVGIDHVGFMATADEEPGLAAAALAAGFAEPRVFPSTILTRQLGHLAGRGPVPTTIFKAGGTTGAVEIAIPHAEPELVEEWIGTGIGAHVALRVEDAASLPEVRALLEPAGFRMPAFMDGEPLRNPAERVTAALFDRRPADPLGLEFCHYA